MAQIIVRGNPVNTVGELPPAGSIAPSFQLTKMDMTPLSSEELAGQRVVLNIFPSLDTGTCAQSVRTFNEKAAGLENTTVLNVSADLPMAQARFCGAEGIDNAITASTFRNSTFPEDYGTGIAEGPLEALNARSVVVLDTDGTVLYSAFAPELINEPDYDAALSVL